MTLEIPDDLQEQIERAAVLRGTTPQSFVLEATLRALEDAPALPKGSRRAAIEAARGSLRGLVSSDEFLSERRSEAQREFEQSGTTNSATS